MTDDAAGAVRPATRHLLLGGQRSGKSRHAEQLALGWLRGVEGDAGRDGADHRPGGAAPRRATLVATAEVRDGDDEWRARVERHRRDRPAELHTAEVPRGLGGFIAAHSEPSHLLVVDCLTLWLAQCLFAAGRVDPGWPTERDALLDAVANSAGPLLLVSNEAGLGVVPMGRETRAWVDELGRLHQALAARCSDVTLMVAGLPLAIKRAGAAG